MQVKVIKDAQVLMPNKEHQNFTFTGEVIPAGNILTGHRAQVDGKRRGQDFKYRIFETTDKKIIYQIRWSQIATTYYMTKKKTAIAIPDETVISKMPNCTRVTRDCPACKAEITPPFRAELSATIAEDFSPNSNSKREIIQV